MKNYKKELDGMREVLDGIIYLGVIAVIAVGISVIALIVYLVA